MPLRYQTVVVNEYGEDQPENAAKFQKAAKNVFVKDYEVNRREFTFLQIFIILYFCEFAPNT